MIARALLLVVVFVVIISISQAAVKELQVTTLYRPEDCDREAHPGDHMWMHYTGTIDESSESGNPEKSLIPVFTVAHLSTFHWVRAQ